MKLQSAVTLHAAVARGYELTTTPQHTWTVCVDFDGVLNHSSGPYSANHFGPPIPEGLKLLKMLKEQGWNVVIHTARKNHGSVERWLAGQGFPGMLVTSNKVAAVAYIDDRALPWNENDSKAEDILKYLQDKTGEDRILKLKA
jgi:hypothetical protein